MLKRNAFNLIELLVVLSIIGILTSMLLPSLSGARAKARCKTCLNQLKQISVISIMYSTDGNDYIPPCWQRNAGNN